jgi:hypothetical protein
MNNGITVESGDKFKALIDKIATLADNEGKGIQFASGTVSASSQIGYVLLQGTNGHTSNSGYLVEITSLSFKPMIVLLANSDDTPVVAAYNNECFINLENGYRNMEMATLTSSVENMTNLKLLDNGFRLATKNTGLYTYYAIGVGEEDTTLRDSLASILQEEGVSITEEDDMASLISKVDNEFDNIKQELTTVLTNKNIEVTESNTFSDLIGFIDKIPSVNVVAGTSTTLYSNGSFRCYNAYSASFTIPITIPADGVYRVTGELLASESEIADVVFTTNTGRRVYASPNYAYKITVGGNYTLYKGEIVTVTINNHSIYTASINMNYISITCSIVFS